VPALSLPSRALAFSLAPEALLDLELEPVGPPELLSGRKIFALAGIARPRRFTEVLEQLSAKIVGRLEVPDHYRYTRSDLRRILKGAVSAGAELLVTTEKDAVRLPPASSMKILVLRVSVTLDVEGETLLQETLRRL
jgi:tetraacyldisaccharide 4'-kinase